MLLKAILQAADLRHQRLLELVLADGLWLLSIFVCLASSFLSGRLTRSLDGPSRHFLLLLQVLERLVDLVLISSLRLIGLLDEVRKALHVLACRVLHANGAS